MPKTKRPPIVAVLGHVDHGKTSLLDYIRQTRVAQKEAGGITQRIGAYQVNVKTGAASDKITFIDTPGHQAFSKMRSRGANVADLVVIVVAVDDGVMPQTIESIEYAREANAPFLIALNKIDLLSADPERVRKQLAQNGVLVEGYGGDIVCLPVSAKTGQGVDELLEMIALMSQLEGIESDPGGPLEAVIIESKKDKTGSTGTVVVRNGSLKVGDLIEVGGVSAKVRGLISDESKNIEAVLPGQPAEVLGFEVPPPVGATVVKVRSVSTQQTSNLPRLKLPTESEKKFFVILKADTAGSLEALSTGVSENVFIVNSAVGDISESDVLMARSTHARLYGFRVKAPGDVLKLAESEKVVIKTYKIIYEFFKDLDEEVNKFLEPVDTTEIIGKALVVAEFVLEGSRVAGCRVIEGRINKNDQLRLVRGEKIIGETVIVTMRQRAKVINEAHSKEEFGAVINPLLDFKTGDMLVSFRQRI